MERQLPRDTLASATVQCLQEPGDKTKSAAAWKAMIVQILNWMTTHVLSSGSQSCLASKALALQVREVKSQENWFTNDHCDNKAHRRIQDLDIQGPLKLHITSFEAVDHEEVAWDKGPENCKTSPKASQIKIKSKVEKAGSFLCERIFLANVLFCSDPKVFTPL